MINTCTKFEFNPSTSWGSYARHRHNLLHGARSTTDIKPWHKHTTGELKIITFTITQMKQTCMTEPKTICLPQCGVGEEMYKMKTMNSTVICDLYSLNTLLLLILDYLIPDVDLFLYPLSDSPQRPEGNV